MDKTVSNFLLGFLAGAAAGAIAGILFAPDKGSKTRQNLREKVRDLSDEFGLGINELIDELGMETEPASRPKRKTARKPQASSYRPQAKQK
jgi:gas vesicle protein